MAPVLREGAHGAGPGKTDMRMFDPEFFPTPKAVVKQMLEPWLSAKDLHDDSEMNEVVARATLKDMLVLEPSAGSGALLKAFADLVDPRGHYGRYHANENIHCIERNPELAAILKEDDWQVVHDDFLTFETNLRYDLILMNPPFSNGDEHLLKAWDVLKEGDIVCLLNASTIKLPYTERRKRLKSLIEAHGSVEYIGAAFRTAERPTDVEIALVRLHKQDEQATFGFFDDPAFDRGDTNKEDLRFTEDNMSTPAVNDVVKVYVEQFQEAQAAFVEYMKARHRMERKARLFVGSYSSKLEDMLRDATRSGSGKQQYNRFSSALQAVAWNLVFGRTKVHDLMSQSVRRNFEKMQKGHGAVAFTEANIHGLFEMLFLNRHEILKQSLVDAFEQMTRYHAHNRIDEGWATNDAYKVNRKVIMPYAVEQGYHANMRLKDSYERTVNDVDRALAMLNGKKLSQVLTAAQALSAHFKDYKVNAGALEDNTVESEHFKLRFFKKGTVHLWFRDEKLWERFNIAAAQGKNWLPHDYGREATQEDTNPAAERVAQLLLGA